MSFSLRKTSLSWCWTNKPRQFKDKSHQDTLCLSLGSTDKESHHQVWSLLMVDSPRYQGAVTARLLKLARRPHSSSKRFSFTSINHSWFPLKQWTSMKLLQVPPSPNLCLPPSLKSPEMVSHVYTSLVWMSVFRSSEFSPSFSIYRLALPNLIGFSWESVYEGRAC